MVEFSHSLFNRREISQKRYIPNGFSTCLGLFGVDSMIRVLKVIFIIIGLSISTLGCKNRKLIDKQTIANAYVDILIIKEEFPSNRDSLIANQKKVFEKYGLTKKSYEGTLKSYKFDKDVWADFFKTVYTRIDSLKSREERLKIKSNNTEKKSKH